MEARAVSKYIRLGPRKVGQVLKLISGKSVNEAYGITKFVRRRAVIAVEKTLKSAVANLKSTKDLNQIYVSEAHVGQGPSLKRMRPAAMGRGVLYKRKMCHITIKVKEKEKEKEKGKVKVKGKGKEE